MPKMNKYDRTHLSHLSAYERLVDAVYREYMRKLTSLMPLSGEIKPSDAFSFDECPNIRKRAESLLDAMREGLFAVIVNGIDSEWTLANNKNNELSRQVFGENIGRLTQEQYRRYFSSNGSARDAFVQRRTAGMNLSDRVWNLTSQFKCEMEQVIDISIRNGIPAEEMQRDLQQYLKNPDNFFRRFRFKEGVDEMGNPIYGRKWKKRYWDDATGGYKWMDVDLNDPKYRYGRGVYRSSYKNARRLAVTETNIAYRTADHLRWQQMDFVVGIRIEPSKTNHPVPDICDFLAGDYPKDFKWTGWHPHCRCHATSILKTPEEMAEDNRRILAGQEPVDGSVNEVSDYPLKLKAWADNNSEKIIHARTVPYFVSDNKGVFRNILGVNSGNLADTDVSNRSTKMAVPRSKIIGVSAMTTREENVLRSFIERTSAKNGLFKNMTDIRFSDTMDDGTLLSWRDGVLSISKVRIKIDETADFCPADDLLNAFRKLKEKKTLTFNEEYAIECLFHESVHARAIKSYNVIAGTVDEKVLEACTQLYARNRYVKILQSFGVEPVNFDNIQLFGYGYKETCKLLRPLFTKGGELQLGELINIANETTSGRMMLQKKLTSMGLTDAELKAFFQRLFRHVL